MSKLSSDTVHAAVKELLAHSHAKDTKRGFLESVELQIALKNYDLSKDKRFSGSVRLPYIPRPKFTVCLLADQKHSDEAKALGVDYLDVNGISKLGKDSKDKKAQNKAVKKLAQKYNAFLASNDLIKKIPKLMGPGLMRAGKFPSVVTHNDDLAEKVADTKATVKFQLKKVMCMGVAVGNVSMSEDELVTNITLAVNFLVSLLKKNWQNVKRLYVKSSMGPSHRIFGF
jgi:large subunit ribosomal protein L10Ae